MEGAAAITTMIAALRETQRSMSDMSLQATKVNEQAVVDLNRQQMLGGINSDGSVISPPYAALTMRLKRTSNPTPNLKDTGQFQGAMRLDLDFVRGEIRFTSADRKTAALEFKYGPNIFGLTETSLSKAASIIKPTLIRMFREKLLR